MELKPKPGLVASALILGINTVFVLTERGSCGMERDGLVEKWLLF